jgi:hypothetical protein
MACCVLRYSTAGLPLESELVLSKPMDHATRRNENAGNRSAAEFRLCCTTGKEVQEMKSILQNLKFLVPNLAAAMPITFDLPFFVCETDVSNR